MNRDCFWLTEDQFARLQPLLPTDTRGKPRVDDRRVISGIVHVLKSGGRWVDAPSIYGPRKTLYNRFVRWAAKGVWVDIFHALASAGGPPEQVPDPVPEGPQREQSPVMNEGKLGATSRAIAHAKIARPSSRLPIASRSR